MRDVWKTTNLELARLQSDLFDAVMRNDVAAVENNNVKWDFDIDFARRMGIKRVDIPEGKKDDYMSSGLISNLKLNPDNSVSYMDYKSEEFQKRAKIIDILMERDCAYSVYLSSNRTDGAGAETDFARIIKLAENAYLEENKSSRNLYGAGLSLFKLADKMLETNKQPDIWWNGVNFEDFWKELYADEREKFLRNEDLAKFVADMESNSFKMFCNGEVNDGYYLNTVADTLCHTRNRIAESCYKLSDNLNKMYSDFAWDVTLIKENDEDRYQYSLTFKGKQLPCIVKNSNDSSLLDIINDYCDMDTTEIEKKFDRAKNSRFGFVKNNLNKKYENEFNLLESRAGMKDFLDKESALRTELAEKNLETRNYGNLIDKFKESANRNYKLSQFHRVEITAPWVRTFGYEKSDYENNNIESELVNESFKNAIEFELAKTNLILKTGLEKEDEDLQKVLNSSEHANRVTDAAENYSKGAHTDEFVKY